MDLRPIRVLIVDDSALMRKLLSDVLAADPAIEVVGFARNGHEAIAKADSLRPDVMTLDVEMPELDGTADAVHRGIGRIFGSIAWPLKEFIRRSTAHDRF